MSLCRSFTPFLLIVDIQGYNCLCFFFPPSFLGVGKTRARDAALNAIQSPLLDIGIERATGIVWNITGGTDLTLYEVPLLLLIGIRTSSFG